MKMDRSKSTISFSDQPPGPESEERTEVVPSRYHSAFHPATPATKYRSFTPITRRSSNLQQLRIKNLEVYIEKTKRERDKY